MKRIFYDRNGRVKKPFFPFWQPWGCLGCLWRVLVFLLGMMLIALLLNLLFRGCDGLSDPRDDEWSDDDPIEKPYEPKEPLPSEITDPTPVPDWNDSIPGVDELPPPEENFIPPVDSTGYAPDPEDSTGYVIADQIVVILNSTDTEKDITSFAQQFKKAYPGDDYRVAYYNVAAGTMLLQVPEDRVEALVDEIPTKVTGLKYKLTTNPVLNYMGKPSDPDFRKASYSGYFESIQAYDAWDITKGSPDVKVAIVDSYFALDHPELNKRYVDPIHIPSKTRNVLPRVIPNPRVDPMGYAAACHGTHVAGIAIGNQDNGTGVSGIAPECKWIPISLGNELTLFNIIEGILYGVYHDASVVNVSLGKMFPKDIDKLMPRSAQVKNAKTSYKRLEDVWAFVYQTAYDHRCIIVKAAGNDNIVMGMDPATRNDHIVKVEAAASPDEKADFSSYGTIPADSIRYSTVSAPGVGIHSSVPGGRYEDWPGTSMASPIVTGAIALMKSLDKSLTPDQVVKILRETGKAMPAKNHTGPLIQISDALKAVKGDLLKFDEVMDDHSKLIGEWEGTTILDLMKGETTEKLDEMYVTMKFSTTAAGYIEYRTINSKLTYRADLSVAFEKDNINIAQAKDAVCITDPSKTIMRDQYTCKPDKDGLLLVRVSRDGKERFNFNMRKSK